MIRRAIIFFAGMILLTGAIPFSPASAQKVGSWDGTWSGIWIPGNGTTSVTIVAGRIARYEYRGKPVPVTIAKIERSIVTFGTAGHYAIRVTRIGPNTASATYESFLSNDVAAADLTRN